MTLPFVFLFAIPPNESQLKFAQSVVFPVSKESLFLHIFFLFFPHKNPIFPNLWGSFVLFVVSAPN